MWFNGPKFLNDINSDFSQFESIENLHNLSEERKITLTIIPDKNNFGKFLNFLSFFKIATYSSVHITIYLQFEKQRK
jgi:ribosomal protein L7Ae-like RNA K-turn-binding protein